MTELQGAPGGGWALRGERKGGDTPEGTQDLGAFDAVVLSDAMAGSSGALPASLCTLAPRYAAQAVKLQCLVLAWAPRSRGWLEVFQAASVELWSSFLLQRPLTKGNEASHVSMPAHTLAPIVCDSWQSLTGKLDSSLDTANMQRPASTPPSTPQQGLARLTVTAHHGRCFMRTALPFR